MKTNIELVKFAEMALKENWGYCLGSFGNILTDSFLNAKLTQSNGVGAYNTRHKAYLLKYKNKRVTDCYGLVKAFVWWNGGKVQYNPRQDRNQEGAYNASKEKGPLNTIPEIPGLVLWMKGHAGIYIGNGEFIECVGAPIGMRNGRIANGKIVSGSKFTHWFKDTYITYVKEESKPAPLKKEVIENVPILVNGKELAVRGYIVDGITSMEVQVPTGVIVVPVRAFYEKLGYKVGFENGKVVIE